MAEAFRFRSGGGARLPVVLAGAGGGWSVPCREPFPCSVTGGAGSGGLPPVEALRELCGGLFIQKRKLWGHGDWLVGPRFARFSNSGEGRARAHLFRAADEAVSG